MARKQGKSRSDAPGSLNQKNEKAWKKYLEEHLHDREGTRETIRELFAAFKVSRFYQAPSRPPQLPRPLRPWDNSEALNELAAGLVETIRAGRMSDLSSRSGLLPFIPDTGIQRIVSACMSCLESGELSAGSSRQLQDFLSAVRRSALNRGRPAWNTIGHGSYFKWPSTDVFEGRSRSIVDTTDWEKEGPLKVIGYAVGVSSRLTRLQRETLLRTGFERNIAAYVSVSAEEWGDAASPRRLRKMAESIAAFTRNAKRNRSGDYRQAVADWERDLKFLHSEYYLPMFNIYNSSLKFDWPETETS
jgi:hypothetical protein